MTKPPASTEPLWRALADQQDRAAAESLHLQSTARALSDRLFAKRRRAWPYVGTALVGVGALAALLLVWRAQPLRFRLEASGEEGRSGRTLTADAQSELPLQFSDGSKVIFQPASAGRVQRLTGAGAEVVLERGRLDAHVIHRADTVWVVRAGGYHVRVTGTRFSVEWSGVALVVAVQEGSVVVDGTLHGAGVPLRAGQQLAVDVASGMVRTTPAAGEVPRVSPETAASSLVESPIPPTVPAFDPGGSFSRASAATGPAAISPPDHLEPSRPVAPISLEPGPPPAHDSLVAGASSAKGPSPILRVETPLDSKLESSDWLWLADSGAYDEALVRAHRIGIASLCRHADAMALLRLGDVARYAGAPAEARMAFEALVSRFPSDELTPDAIFSLGRLAFEAEQPQVAARWFRQYLERWPQARFSDQSAGRLIECALRAGDRAGAQDAARAYLARSPHGSRVGLARRTLGEGR